MIRNLTSLAAENPESLAEKGIFALENSVLGLIITFAVLILMALVVRIVANVINGKKKTDVSAEAPTSVPAPAVAPTPAPATTDDGELIAAITAAISLMLESDGKDPSGFRVVSFRRSSSRK